MDSHDIIKHCFLCGSSYIGDLILLTCHVVVGEGRDIKILWFNSSKPTESMYWGKELNLTNRIALKTKNRYQEKYWCTVYGYKFRR